MRNIEEFQKILSSVIEYAEIEKAWILEGKDSLWSLSLIQNVIIPETSELLDHAKKGEVFFKHGKKHRLLESTYYMTDEVKNLYNTRLGSQIALLQHYYDRL